MEALLGFMLSSGVARAKTWRKGIVALVVHTRLGSTLTWSSPPVSWETVCADGDFLDLEPKIVQVVKPVRKYATLDWVDHMEARMKEVCPHPRKAPKQAPSPDSAIASSVVDAVLALATPTVATAAPTPVAPAVAAPAPASAAAALPLPAEVAKASAEEWPSAAQASPHLIGPDIMRVWDPKYPYPYPNCCQFGRLIQVG